jgi:hypothetical protein
MLVCGVVDGSRTGVEWKIGCITRLQLMLILADGEGVVVLLSIQIPHPTLPPAATAPSRPPQAVGLLLAWPPIGLLLASYWPAPRPLRSTGLPTAATCPPGYE